MIPSPPPTPDPTTPAPADAGRGGDAQPQPSVWCVVANVTKEPHPEGPDGAMRLGTKHFAPGAKLYCFPQAWGDGCDRLWVLGRHRGGGPKLLRIVVSTKWLTNWRAQEVFHPYVVHVMKNEHESSDESRMKAEIMVDWLSNSTFVGCNRVRKEEAN